MANPNASLKVNLGCGGRWNAGWRNLDGGPWTRVLWLRSLPVPERLLPAPTRRYPRDLIRWDLRRVPLPFEVFSAVIFSQWVLEYLTVEEAVHTLTDCNRVLLPGGLIRLCQTDIGAIVSSYLAEGDVAPTSEAVERARRFLASAAPDHTSLWAGCFVEAGSSSSSTVRPLNGCSWRPASPTSGSGGSTKGNARTCSSLSTSGIHP